MQNAAPQREKKKKGYIQQIVLSNMNVGKQDCQIQPLRTVFISGVCDQAWSIWHRKNLQYRGPIQRPPPHPQVFHRWGRAARHSFFSPVFLFGNRCSSFSFLSTTRLPPAILTRPRGGFAYPNPVYTMSPSETRPCPRLSSVGFFLSFTRTIKAKSPGNRFSKKMMFFSLGKSKKMRPFKRAGITGIASHYKLMSIERVAYLLV